MKAVETFNLTKHYSRGKVKALNDFSLQVETGQIFSLLGPNGAGKTTFIKLLVGLAHPTAGHATVFGKSIKNYKMHQHIGYLSENHRFPEFLTAAQVLYYYGKMSGVSSSDLKDRIPKLLKQVNLTDWTNVKIQKYSKGMMQRLGLANALIPDPDILFLDEPTDGIDPVGRREIRDLLKALREQGKTVFLNSHLLSEVERVSDEVAILKNGKLLQKGRVEDFISVKEQYQVKVISENNKINEISEKLSIPVSYQNEFYNIAVQDDAHLNKFIDSVRRESITIQAIIPRKISLEDFFIDVIEDKNGEVK
ncbi:MAG: ABC transporter ATP-binding protein [Calditrichaceae bacterium]|nr:ABC transporter ATP-binding protein [Calditrichaceae bacterium]